MSGNSPHKSPINHQLMIGGILITHTHTHTHTPYNTYPQILIQVVDGDWDVTASRLHTHREEG